MLDSRQFAEVIRSHEPNLEVRRVVPIHEGWDSIVFEVNGEYMFRFPRREDVVAQYGMELQLLPLLTERLKTPVPEPAFVGRGDNGRLQFFGYSKIEGRPLLDVATSAEQAAALAAACASFLGELHAVPVADLSETGIPTMDAGSCRADLQAFRERIRRDAFSHLSSGVRANVDETWDTFLSRDDNFAFDTTLIHGDLSPEAHILCIGDRISGVIDWGDACVGDPALDFTGLFHACGRSFTERVLASYTGAAGPGFLRRVSFYRWLIPFHEIEFALATDSKEHLERGLSALKLGQDI